jgi:hypothetical protein
MIPFNTPLFIYTSFLTASHIIIHEAEPEITLVGMYANLVTGEIENLQVDCAFTQLNDILYCSGDGTDKIMEQVADLIAAGITESHTIDVTNDGGLECGNLLYCLQNVQQHATGLPVANEYSLVACINKKPVVEYDTLKLPQGRHEQLSYYLSVLAIQYSFYLHFKTYMQEEEARVYSGLNEGVVYQLSKLQYEFLNATNRC